MAICVICLEEVESDIVQEEMGYMFTQADALGNESLTEREQVVVEGRCCSFFCYEHLE